MSKLSNLRKAIASKELDALLIMSPKNRRYLSGFVGSSGALLVTREDAVLITDFRYTEQAAEQAKEFQIIEHKTAMPKAVAEKAKQLGLKNRSL